MDQMGLLSRPLQERVIRANASERYPTDEEIAAVEQEDAEADLNAAVEDLLTVPAACPRSATGPDTQLDTATLCTDRVVGDTETEPASGLPVIQSPTQPARPRGH